MTCRRNGFIASATRAWTRAAITFLLVVGSNGLAGGWPAEAALPNRIDDRLDSLEAALDELEAESLPGPSLAGGGSSKEAEGASGPDQVALEPLPVPAVISLTPGEVRSLEVDGITRVVLGNPEVADISILSANEVLLQALAAGATNLILWDRRGQHPSSVEVVDRAPEVQEEQLRKLIQGLNLPTVQVRREGSKLFLTGEVTTQEELDRLEQMLSAFKDVTNLVAVPVPPPPPAEPPAPLVELLVQVIELNREDLERLGVDWSDSTTITEQAFSSGAAGTITENAAVLDFETSIAKRVGEVFRIGRLHRIPTTAKLNALVQNNKARLLAEPKLVTASGKEASSFVGVEVPIIKSSTTGTGTATTSVSVEFRKTGVLLTMTPTVNDNDSITLLVKAEVSEIDTASGLTLPVGSSSALVPGFTVREVSSEVNTMSGQTVLMAGLLKSEDSLAVAAVPGLGRLPVLGRLFSSPETKYKQRELVITVTPELAGVEEMTSDRSYLLEQALASAEVAGSVSDPMLRYALQIQDRIARSLRYPAREKELGMSGRVKLRLHLFRDGTLGKAMVAEPSGIQVFDAEALKAAESQSPYPPFPSDIHAQDFWLEIPVLFRP